MKVSPPFNGASSAVCFLPAARLDAAGLAPERGLEGVPRQPCVRSAIALAAASADHRMWWPVTSLGGLSSRRGHVRSPALPALKPDPDETIDISVIDPDQPLPASPVLSSAQNNNVNKGAWMPKSREESGGGRTRVLSPARRRRRARRAPLIGTVGTLGRFPKCGSPIALARFARMRSRRRFGDMQKTATVATSRLRRGRHYSEAVRETGHVIRGRGSEAASRPFLPRQNSFLVRPPDRHVLVNKTGRPCRAIGRPDRWHCPHLHYLTRTPTEVPS